MAKWYVSATAVKEYGGIFGLGFDEAERRLLDLMDQIDETKPSKDEGRFLIFRCNTRLDGRKTRLELTVSRSERSEGPYDQLVRVRDKGRGTTKGRGVQR